MQLRSPTKKLDELLVDQVILAWVEWQEDRAVVWDAYDRWVGYAGSEAALAFSAYRAALDREERAAQVYETRIARIQRPAGVEGRRV